MTAVRVSPRVAAELAHAVQRHRMTVQASGALGDDEVAELELAGAVAARAAHLGAPLTVAPVQAADICGQFRPELPDGPDDELIAVRTAARHLRRDERTLRRWRAQGLVREVRITGRVFIPLGELRRIAAGD